MLSLQSFVVAAVIFAVFMAERLGGTVEVTRRAFQVSLGFALTFAVLSATTALLRTESVALNDLALLDDLSALAALEGNDAANRAREAAAIEAGIGVGLIVLGLMAMRRFSTLPLGVVVGGVLLVFVGGQAGGAGYPSALLDLSFLWCVSKFAGG